jgi:hypothetical protein
MLCLEIAACEEHYAAAAGDGLVVVIDDLEEI